MFANKISRSAAPVFPASLSICVSFFAAEELRVDVQNKNF